MELQFSDISASERSGPSGRESPGSRARDLKPVSGRGLLRVWRLSMRHGVALYESRVASQQIFFSRDLSGFRRCGIIGSGVRAQAGPWDCYFSNRNFEFLYASSELENTN